MEAEVAERRHARGKAKDTGGLVRKGDYFFTQEVEIHQSE